MTGREPDVQPPYIYECVACGNRTRAESNPGECTECGGGVKNISRSREV